MRINDDILVKEQAKTISKLQDTINILKFEISQLAAEKRSLSGRLNNSYKNTREVKKELLSMKRKNDFSNINLVLMMLKTGQENEE